jgi:hypothetical protein
MARKVLMIYLIYVTPERRFCFGEEPTSTSQTTLKFNVHHDRTFKGGIAFWKGPNAYLMLLQFPKTDVRPLYCGPSIVAKILYQLAAALQFLFEAELCTFCPICDFGA